MEVSMFSLFKHKNTAFSLVFQIGPVIETMIVFLLVVIAFCLRGSLVSENAYKLMMGIGFAVLVFGMPLITLRGIAGIIFSTVALIKKEPKIANIILLITLAITTVSSAYVSYYIWFVSTPSV